MKRKLSICDVLKCFLEVFLYLLCKLDKIRNKVSAKSKWCL